MTNKELLYIDDALNHLQTISGFIRHSCDSSSDDKICSTLETIDKKNKELFNNFYSLIK